MEGVTGGPLPIRILLAVLVAGLLILAGCEDPFSEPSPIAKPGDTTIVQKPDTVKPKPDTAKPKPDTSKPITSIPDTTKPKPDTTTPKPDTTKPVTPSCTGSDWVSGKQYNAGDIVRYPSTGKWYKCTNANPGYDPTISTWFWAAHSCTGTVPVDTTKPKPDTTKPVDPKPDTTKPKPDTTKPATGFAAYFTEAMFKSFYPRRNTFYTYQGLVDAVNSYAGFATTGDETARKREVAAFLANVNHETGGLYYIEEINKGDYCGNAGSAGCQCQPGKKYYGRGPLQLSWNYNYGTAGKALNLPLCTDPDLIARDSKVAWQTAIWFWMTSTGAGSRTCHDGITGGAGFGSTIRTINGGLECDGKNPGTVKMRVDAYNALCKLMGVDPGANTGC